MRQLKILYFFLLKIICVSCAQITAPTGGPKDTIPPILIKVIPTNKQINFKEKTLVLTFNETIIANNPKEQIIITPTIGKEFEMTAHKNKATLVLSEELQDSTTYTLNFRDAVQDITEKNSARNLQVAFSTGPFIDSLSIQGKVYDLLMGKEVKDATVAIFQNKDTFNIFKHRPSYLTKADKKGEFIIENLKAGSYYIYAFQDKNKNLIVDSKTESYGFLSSALALHKNIKEISIPILRLDARPLKVTGARPYKSYVTLKTSKNVKHYSLKTKTDSIEMVTCYGEDQANIIIYNTIDHSDSLQVKFAALDSLGNKLDTVLYIKFNEPGKKIEPEKFSVTIKESTYLPAKNHLSIKLLFSKPIFSVNFDSLLFKLDSATITKFSPTDILLTRATNEVNIFKTLDKNLVPKKPEKEPAKEIVKSQQNTAKPIIKNQLYLGQTAFISIDLDSSELKKETVKMSKPEDLGIILAEIKTEEQNFIIELLDKNAKIIKTASNTKKFRFEDLPPAEYQLRLVVDLNANKQWDPGNYFLKEEPEKLIFYKSEKETQLINLKANWEIGPLLITY